MDDAREFVEGVLENGCLLGDALRGSVDGTRFLWNKLDDPRIGFGATRWLAH